MQSVRVVAAVAAALAVALGAGLGVKASGVPQRAPSVAYTLLDGQRSTTDRLRGKVVLVNFWATSCAACVHEMPQLAATYEKYKGRGYETLAVAMRYDPPASVIRYAETRKLPFGVVIDNTGAVARSFGNVEATPTSVLINKRGEIVQRFIGTPDFAQLDALVEKLLAEA
ncbi:MAG TPA: TlpA disulfide reductase family protein [Albitalea sp.]|nr:TlpA disulfide reductase family protein [Albitalea sp.]